MKYIKNQTFQNKIKKSQFKLSFILKKNYLKLNLFLEEILNVFNINKSNSVK